MNGRLFRILVLFMNLSLFSEPNRVVLVTGGAGYIGSHTCKALKEAGFIPLVYDSLQFGEKEAVKWGPLVEGNLLDTEALDRAFTQYLPEAVFHFASLRNVGDSVKDPANYYTNNVVGSINLLNAMIKHRVKYFVFSSSCTVFGNCPFPAISEVAPQAPINPYGVSKHIIERIIRDYAHAYPLKYVILRYFNAAGLEAGLKRSTYSSNFLIPRAIRAIFDPASPLQIFGSDYESEDGTAIRDYIHVKDLACAHVMALHHLFAGEASNDFNLGTGKGYSVLQIIREIEKVTGLKVPYELKPPREGDVCRSVASITKAQQVLGFELNYSDLNAVIKSEWNSFLGK